MAKVLVVDDVKFITQMLADILKKEGHEVETAIDGNVALEKVRTFDPELVLTDVAMPGFDGLDLVRELKGDAATRHIPVMVISSRNDARIKRESKECGAEEFITKPFDTPILLEKVAKLLGGYRMSFSIDVDSAIPVVTALNSEVTGNAVAQLGQALETARGGGGRPMVLDMSRVTKAGPSVPDVINSFAEAILAAGGTLQIVKPGKGIGTAAITAKVDRRVGVFDDRPPAVAAALPSNATPRSSVARGEGVEVESRGRTMLVKVLRVDLGGGTLRRIERLVKGTDQHVTLEMTGVMQLSSSDLARLSTMAHKVQSAGREIRIVNAESAILDDLRAGGLEPIVLRNGA